MTDLMEKLESKGYVKDGVIQRYKLKAFLKDNELIALLNTAQPTARSPREALFLYTQGLKEIPKCVCGNPLIFKGNTYSRYCSCKCSNSSAEGIATKKQKMLEKYGVAHYSSTLEYKQKFKATMQSKYGVDNPNQLPDVKEKKKSTYNRTLGVDNPSQSETVKEKKKYKAWVAMRSKLLTSQRLANLVSPLFDIQDYQGVDHKYLWKCSRCGTEFLDHLKYGKIPTCPKCFFGSLGVSKIEKEISQWIQSLGVSVQENVKGILNKTLEVDIWIPSKSVAIEVNGIYWHSERHGNKDRNYHLQKQTLAARNQITLLQIWDTEWINSKEKIQSILKNYLGLSATIPARKCKIVTISKQEANAFFETNHLQGSASTSTIHLALQFQGETVQAMSFGKARYSSQHEWELLRSATKLQYRVIGGVSKLIHFFTHTYSDSLISYCDKRFFSGKGYIQSGFVKIRESPPNYYYFKGAKCSSLFSREKFQKHKLIKILPVFDPALTEWENMQLNDYDRIWDCGMLVFSYKGFSN